MQTVNKIRMKKGDGCGAMIQFGLGEPSDLLECLDAPH